jgi:hypothetical protein
MSGRTATKHERTEIDRRSSLAEELSAGLSSRADWAMVVGESLSDLSVAWWDSIEAS